MRFFADLTYELQSPNHEDIIAWSEDGKILLIKQYGLIEEEILPYFEYCLTVSSFAKQVSISFVDPCQFVMYSFKGTILCQFLGKNTTYCMLFSMLTTHGTKGLISRIWVKENQARKAVKIQFEHLRLNTELSRRK